MTISSSPVLCTEKNNLTVLQALYTQEYTALVQAHVNLPVTHYYCSNHPRFHHAAH